jgi:hypothetical protein
MGPQWLRTFEGVEPMGRGRAKAKQVKVARQLKYNGGGTDLDRLRAELGVGSETEHRDDYDTDADGDSEDDDDEPDEDEDGPEEVWGRKPARLTTRRDRRPSARRFEHVLAAFCFGYLHGVLAIEAGAA